MKKTILLVIDESGFIGSHLVEALVKRGYKVNYRGTLNIDESTLPKIESMPANSMVEVN